MHALRSTRNFLAGLGLAAVFIGAAPHAATALPVNPFAKNTYKLFARAISFINVNRVYMGLNSIGEVGVDSAGRGTTQGGFWPRGTPDNYIFNAGLQVAGVIAGTKSTANPWGGDTTGVWFFDGAGGRPQAEAVTPVYQAFNSADAANWPAQSYVPEGDSVASVYATPLQGLISASQGDAQFLAWDGNPAYNVSRPHPLGILADYRLLAWNYPAGAQDVVFLVGTVYNITSANCSDYATARPSMQQLLCDQGAKFQTLNNAKYNIQLPAGGYTITNAYMAAAEDDDVGTVGANFNGVILPFAMGYTYDGPFTSAITGWKFDPTIFGPPFFTGSGFVGTKYLKGPDGPGEIQLMQTFCNGGAVCGTGHSDPANIGVEYRLLAGQPYATDGQCNVTTPGKTPAQVHVCFMLTGSTGADTRRLESSTVFSLAPGQYKTIVVAYVYAAPVAIPGFTPSTIQYDPGNVTWSNSTDSMFKYNQSGQPGLNKVDSISGFLGYKGPHFNADGSVHVPTQDEFSVVKGSLLGKALVAQAVFDAKFLQEFSPDAPQFFLIPGDAQVTILWKPSDTETIGDPYFQIVSSPTQVVNGLTVANPLYDPNYRQYDVEGYRIYRGRSDAVLALLAQFDYAGTKIKDYTGFVVSGNCAPEVGVLTDCPATTPAGGFPTPTNPVPPGTAYTRYVAYNIGPQGDASPLRFVDQTAGVRYALAGGINSIATVVDTVVSGAGDGGFPALQDTGVPFIFVDKSGAAGCAACGVNNGVNYYYSVTAFDVNSPGHGPTSLESAKVTKQVVPQAPAGNVSLNATTVAGVFGRGATPLTVGPLPTIDSTTGEFSGPFPPSTAVSLSLAALPTQLLNGSGAASIQYDSTQITAISGATSVSIIDWFTGGTTKISVPLTMDATIGTVSGGGSFPAITIDSTLAGIYGGGSGYTIPGAFTYTRQGGYQSGIFQRGCANSAYAIPAGKSSNQCYFQGPRWFSGANESTANPNTIDPLNYFTGRTVAAGYGNAGTLPGVVAAHRPDAYGYLTGGSWRDMELIMAPFATAADYKLYWGAAGHIDSVIDATHNTVVPFKTTIGASWGVLNQSAASGAGSYDGIATLTPTDFTCVMPVPNFSAGGIPACGTARYVLSQTAVPGTMGYCVGSPANCRTPIVAANNGFGLYIKGRVFLFELTGGAVPSAGTVWTERDYIGAIYGGNDPGGNASAQFGKYAFSPYTPLPFTAPGAAVKYAFTVTNSVVPTTADILAKVHTVPDPYYVTSAYDIAVNAKDVQFVNVPTGATIRIYSSSGVLLRVLQNTTTTFGGIVHWDVRNRTNQFVASGVYFYNVQAGNISHTGRMTIVNYTSTVQ